MRIVGTNREHSEVELDPVLAYRRGRALDAMLRTALPPIDRGLRRATAAEFQALDEARARLIARRINAG
jgi:hypothetical protein